MLQTFTAAPLKFNVHSTEGQSPFPLRIMTMKGTLRRRITVMSSLNKISTAQLGNRVGRGIGRYSVHQTSGQIFKDDKNGFSST